MSETFTPEAIIEQAREALAAIDEKIAFQRTTRRNLGTQIASLLEDRKPLARIVAAAQPRQRKAQANGD